MLGYDKIPDNCQLQNKKVLHLNLEVTIIYSKNDNSDDKDTGQGVE